jgi:hypothetical protein
MTNEVKGNEAAILAVVQKVAGVSMASMDTMTEVKLEGGKKNPMLGRVYKLSKGIPVMVCRSNEGGSVAYEKAVNRGLEKEGKPATFTSQGLANWLEVVSFPVLQHKDNGQKYLQLIYKGDPRETSYLLDGQPIAKEDIIGFPRARATTGQGGLEDQVQVRTPKLDSILELRIKGEVI